MQMLHTCKIQEDDTVHDPANIPAQMFRKVYLLTEAFPVTSGHPTCC